MTCRCSVLRSCAAFEKALTRRGPWLLALALLMVGVFAGAPAAAAVTPLPNATCPSTLTPCEAKDLVSTVVEAKPVVEGDLCTSSEDTILLQFTVQFTSTSAQKYDVGFFVSKDGGSVKEPSTAESCAGAAPEPGDGDGPNFFLDEDSPPADNCGDLVQDTPVRWTVTAEVKCTVDVNGILTVPSCRVWQQNAKTVCEGLAEAGTGSKCDCTDLTFEVLDPCVTEFCNDQNPCNGVETCDSSSGEAVCIAGTPLVCNDGNACTTDSCDPALGCVHTAISCNDGKFCTDDSCDTLAGCQHTAHSCDDGKFCTDEVCNEDTNQCDYTAHSCDDGKVCTTDTCEEPAGCVFRNNTDVCVGSDPEDPCTLGVEGKCSGGFCVVGTTVCDDDNSCTTDICDEATGDCSHEFICGVCRTAGFWGTHAGIDLKKPQSQNITQTVLTFAGGSVICGEVINNTILNSVTSALEALCVSPLGDQRLQLGRQLTAMSLNCGRRKQLFLDGQRRGVHDLQ